MLQAWRQLANVEVLKLWSPHLQDLDHLTCLTALRSLDLQQSPAPDCLSQLTGLQQLVICDVCEEEDVVAALPLLRRLTTLSLKINHLGILPTVMPHLQRLSVHVDKQDLAAQVVPQGAWLQSSQFQKNAAPSHCSPAAQAAAPTAVCV